MSTQALSMIPLPPRALVTRGILRNALIESFVKLLPQQQWKNPVMFVVYVGSILTTVLWFQALGGKGEAPAGVHPRGDPVAVVHGAVREFRRSGGRRPQQGAGGGAQDRQTRHHGEEAGQAAE